MGGGVYHNNMLGLIFFNMKPFLRGIHCYEQKISHSHVKKIENILKK